MPAFEADPITFVNFDEENAILKNHAIPKTKRINDQVDLSSDQNTNEKTKGMFTYNESMSDQSTLVQKSDRETQDLEPSCGFGQGAATERDTDIEAFMARNNGVAASTPFVKDSTGECMVHLIEVTTICLDRCRIRGVGSYIPNSDKDEIEVLFHHKGENFWVDVQYGYIKDRGDFQLNCTG
ncbi:hypothetical protein SI65_06018 [Aspergillus cristatus]|uniref:Uncharacterized protein n=1 Tax=Aspergillus cristatus TaxID=573508 RepID=A0A1E3BB16_ASPCR|nr:hypothetical protein SI65_06018 [Aspergillus cristatus]